MTNYYTTIKAMIKRHKHGRMRIQIDIRNSGLNHMINKDYAFGYKIKHNKKDGAYVDLNFFTSAEGYACVKMAGKRTYGVRLTSNMLIGVSFFYLLPEKEDKQLTERQYASMVLNYLHPNAWQPIREEMQAVVDGKMKMADTSLCYQYLERPRRSAIKRIDRDLSDYYKDKIHNAFNLSGYGFSDRIRGMKRDTSFEVTGAIPNIRAWYSSEYAGCANGDYYILLSPTHALFCERD